MRIGSFSPQLPIELPLPPESPAEIISSLTAEHIASIAEKVIETLMRTLNLGTEYIENGPDEITIYDPECPLQELKTPVQNMLTSAFSYPEQASEGVLIPLIAPEETPHLLKEIADPAFYGQAYLAFIHSCDRPDYPANCHSLSFILKIEPDDDGNWILSIDRKLSHELGSKILHCDTISIEEL